jgi:hypothetical protein
MGRPPSGEMQGSHPGLLMDQAIAMPLEKDIVCGDCNAGKMTILSGRFEFLHGYDKNGFD